MPQERGDLVMYPKEFMDKAVNEVVTKKGGVNTVAKKYGMTGPTLRRHVNQWEADNGVKVTKPAVKHDPALIAEATAEYKLGNSSITELSVKYGIPVCTLVRYFPDREEVCQQHIKTAVEEFKAEHTPINELVSKYHIPKKILEPFINAEKAKMEKAKVKKTEAAKAKAKTKEEARMIDKKEEVSRILDEISPIVSKSTMYSEEQVRTALFQYYGTSKNEYEVAEDNHMSRGSFVYYRNRAAKLAMEHGLELKKEFRHRRSAPIPKETIYSALNMYFTTKKSVRKVAREYLISNSTFNLYVHVTVDTAHTIGVELKRTIDAPGYKKKYLDKDVKSAVLDYLTTDKSCCAIAEMNNINAPALRYHINKAKEKILEYGKVIA